jgi:hypothetical protein
MAIFDIWEVSLDGTPNLKNIHERFSPSFVLLHNCSFVSFAYTYGSRTGVYNTLASKICVKKIALESLQTIPIPTPNTCLSDVLTHS